MNTLIGFLLGIFLGAAIGLFIGAIITHGKELSNYEDGFADGIDFIKNKFDNKERRQ